MHPKNQTTFELPLAPMDAAEFAAAQREFEASRAVDARGGRPRRGFSSSSSSGSALGNGGVAGGAGAGAGAGGGSSASISTTAFAAASDAHFGLMASGIGATPLNELVASMSAEAKQHRAHIFAKAPKPCVDRPQSAATTQGAASGAATSTAAGSAATDVSARAHTRNGGAHWHVLGSLGSHT